LLVFHIHLEVTDQNDAAVCPEALLTPAEFARFHIALHDIHAVLLVEGDTRHLVAADHVVLANEPALTCIHMHEYSR
jgi:hypothetical protein